MPQITFDAENKSESANDYPKLKLLMNERARIVLLERAPTFEYTHTIRAPKILNGVLQTVMDKQRDGTEKEVPAFDFIGRPKCLGDYGIVEKRGSDPDHCPVCQAALESEAVKAPERRFATHIFKYQISPGGFTVIEPFGGRIEAWIFADQLFNKLVDIQTEWGNLQARDLNLGPCTQQTFQKFEIQVASSGEWLANEARKTYVAALFKETRSPDIGSLIARSVPRDLVAADVNKAVEKYKIAFGGGASAGTAGVNTVGAEDLAGLLGGTGETPSGGGLDFSALSPDVPATPAVSADILDLPGTPAAAVTAPDVAPTPEATVDDVLAAAAPSQPAKTEVLDFEALLQM